MLLLTPMTVRISNERCQWLALRVWGHAPAFITHNITWHREYETKLNPLICNNWCHFLPKSTQSCYNVFLYGKANLFYANHPESFSTSKLYDYTSANVATLTNICVFNSIKNVFYDRWKYINCYKSSLKTTMGLFYLNYICIYTCTYNINSQGTMT